MVVHQLKVHIFQISGLDVNLHPYSTLAEYSDNFGGACMRCAAGEGGECGGDRGFVCPAELVCAKDPKISLAELELDKRPGAGNATAASVAVSSTGYVCITRHDLAAHPEFDKPKAKQVRHGEICFHPLGI